MVEKNWINARVIWEKLGKETLKKNLKKTKKTKSTFGRIFRWFKLLILIRNVLLRLIY